MSLPDQSPKLPKLPFLIGDALLLVLAWFIVYQTDGPLSPNTIAAVSACVAVGAILGVIPFLTDYARKQDESLDERQRGLEALARTITGSAEQMSIAAAGLQEITELLHRNLKHAEQLPQKLQEKIAEFTAQLENAREDEREELEKEVTELRASESERLQAVSNQIQKAVAELAKLDATAQKHLTARTDLVERGTEALSKAHAAGTEALNAAAEAVAREIASAQTKALAAIDERLAERTRVSVAAIDTAVSEASKTLAAQLALHATVPAAPTTLPPAPSPGSSESGLPPKRPRRRREDPVSAESLSSPVTAAVDPETPTTPTAEGAAPAQPESIPAEPVESIEAAPETLATPVASAAPMESAVEATPAPATTLDASVEAPAVAASLPKDAVPEPTPVSAEPTSQPEAATPPVAVNGAAAPDVASADPAPERPAKKRTRKHADEPELGLDLGEAFSSDDANPAEVVERVISSDGATRLIATAYIGIGNRLFVRGEGPGLSWEKGVPLQFVSIGKWRWETADATAPITVKLYKNDEIECSALGTLTLDPGYQQEVTAKF